MTSGPVLPDVAVTQRTITVPGRGTLRVEPDLGRVRLGVVVVTPSPSEARTAAAVAMEAVIGAIVASGVERKELRTSLVALDAVRDYSQDATPRITGYQLTNTIEVLVRSVVDIGAVIDVALSSGATSVDGLSFEVADPSLPLADARRAAVADARLRATLLADEAGVRLGAVLAIVEDPGLMAGPPRPLMEMAFKSASDSGTPVEAGRLDVDVRIAVTFAIA
ncbi:MAG TPA: SIMPL domain-containing protein [Candidatus Limnocylindrales bacterium]|nr:SIMPL domain-containing protein [Candidatus Limnocylindrales bacterium]